MGYRILFLGMLWLGLAHGQDTVEANVDIFARWFEMDTPIRQATIHAIGPHPNTPYELQTDDNGRAQLQWPVEIPLTLKLQPEDILSGILRSSETQSATVIVPPEGLTGSDREITFQVPTNIIYQIFQSILETKHLALQANNTCTVVTTVTPSGKNLNDCPHGLAGVQVFLDPPEYDESYYFDMFQSGPLACKTNLASFFSGVLANCNWNNSFCFWHQWKQEEFAPVPPEYKASELDRTSEDGGVIFMNVKVREEPYTIRVTDPQNKERKFTAPSFYCHDKGFINISPPHGPKPIKNSDYAESEKEEEGYYTNGCF